MVAIYIDGRVSCPHCRKYMRYTKDVDMDDHGDAVDMMYRCSSCGHTHLESRAVPKRPDKN